MGEAKLTALIQESLSVATRTEAMKPKDLARVVVDTTVQPKAVMFPTDAKLLNQARERSVRLAAHVGVELRQSYARVGKLALIKHQRYAHAHQFKRANRSLRRLKTYLGRRVIRDIGRRVDGNSELEEIFARPLSLSRRVLAQDQRQRGPKVYSLHAQESGVHRQGQGASAVRIRGKGQCRHDRSSLERRPVRDLCRRSAGKSQQQEASSHLSRRWKLYPAAASTALTASPAWCAR